MHGVLALTLLAPLAAAAQADARNDARSGPRAGLIRAEPLLVDVIVNTQALPGVVAAERLPDGRIVLPEAAWNAARLMPAGDALDLPGGLRGFAIDAVPGLTYRLDRALLRLEIDAPSAAFTESNLRLQTRAIGSAVRSKPGLYLNYDLSASRTAAGADTYGAFVEAVAFGPSGSLSSAGVLRTTAGGHELVRTDTTWRTDIPGRMETVTVGDAIGAGGTWSRPVRFGGLRWSRDFQLSPGYVTYPIPSIAGSAALPSTVDILVNNRRQASSGVPPGPFELANVPIVTGAGQVQMVVTDLLGRETVVSQSYYVAPQLLRPGLTDFSFEAGALRTRYGTASADYGPGFGAGTLRLGLDDATTVEGRAEADPDRRAAGGGIVRRIGTLGVATFAGAWSDTGTEAGGRWVGRFQRGSPRGGLGLSWTRSDRGWVDFGVPASAIRTRDEINASVGVALPAGAATGITYTSRTTWGPDAFSFVGMNLSVPLFGNAFLGALLTRQLDVPRGWSGMLTLVVPLESTRLLTAQSARALDGSVTNTVAATQSLPTGPGWGWGVAATDGDTQRLRMRSAYGGNAGVVTAEANAGRDSNAVRLGATGSVGWLDGTGFASRRIDQGAFAVVSVGDIENVPVSVGYRTAATTGRDGRVVVTGLLPYHANTLTLDPDGLPFDVEIGGVQQVVVPYARSGVVVDFPVRRSRDALVILRQAGGAVVPTGARVSLSTDGRSFGVARRGEVYLTDLRDAQRLDVTWSDGRCSADLNLPRREQSAEPLRVGPLECVEAR